MDGMACAIVISTARVVSGTISSGSCERIGVPSCGIVVPVRAVGHSADMTVNISSVAAVVTVDGCRVVVHARNTVGYFGNAVRHGWYTVGHTRHTIRSVCLTEDVVNHTLQI